MAKKKSAPTQEPAEAAPEMVSAPVSIEDDTPYPSVPSVIETVDPAPSPPPTPTEFVKMLLPTHWAREEGKDESLVLYWNKEGAVTRDRYEQIKEEAGVR